MNNKTQTRDNDAKNIENNSEILFIYDAKMCNPNGDPDDENKPRIDYNRNINLVSDVRLKRYIRDYLMDYKKKTIFVSKSKEGASINPKTSLATILGKDNKAKIDITYEEANIFKDQAIDVRMFGAIIPDVIFKEGKGNVTFTGPIQFNWGYSLNKVTGPMESNGITSHFQTGKITEEIESTKGSGAMGKDFRVAYSLIAFHGIISAKRATFTNLTDSDIDLFDEAMLHAIPLEATTRSKIGQCPRLYIRIEYNSSEFFLCDLRNYIKIVNGDNKEIEIDKTINFQSCKDYKLDLTKLTEKIKEYEDKIYRIHFWKHQNLNINGWDINNNKLVIKK